LGSGDKVERRAERVEVRRSIEGAARTPSGWLTTFNATPSVQYATFGTTDDRRLLLRYSSRLGSSDTVQSRAEGFEVRQIIEGAASMPSGWLTTFNGTRSVQYAFFGTAEDRSLLLRYDSRLGSNDTVERRAEGFEVRQFIEGTRPQRRAVGAPPSTRPARYCTQLLGLPTIDASYLGTRQD
jgi:hypothetical protein